MTFLHSEFFLWMLLPVGVLFYFWQTQKPYENHWLGEASMQKLRAPEITMGLKERNTLFLIAAVLLISAMAQPVLLESLPSEGKKARIVFAVQTGTSSEADFENIKKIALQAMGTIVGNDMAVVAFDEQVYRVAPLSDDYSILSTLVRNLSRTAENSDLSRMLSAVAGMDDIDIVVVVTAERMVMEPDTVIVLNHTGDIGAIADRVREQQQMQRLAVHSPLFYYPLGLAMVLILVALSSMSKRRSIGVAALIAILNMAQPPAAEAGFFDFSLLHEALGAYENGEYSKSAALFAKYQQSHDSAEVRYNRANALYKAGRYEQAEFWYRHVYTSKPLLEKHRWYNLAQARKQIAMREKKDDAKNPAQRLKDQEKNRREGGMQGRSGFKTRLYAIP